MLLDRLNPFIYGRPVPISGFVGRTNALSRVLSRMANGESTAVVGEPSIGKTSFLQYIRSQDVRSLFPDEQGKRVFFDVDCLLLNLSFQPLDFWNEVLNCIEISFSFNDPVMRQIGVVRRSRFGSFSLKQLFELMGENHLRVVLLMDEFDVLMNHPNFNTAEFFGSMRSFVTQTQGISLITASRLSVSEMNRKSHEVNPLGSPFFNNLIDIRLEPLYPEDVDRLIEKSLFKTGVDFNFQDVKAIKRLSGCHPLLVQINAAVLFDAILKYGSDTNRFDVAKDSLKWSESHFEDMWWYMTIEKRKSILRVAVAEHYGVTPSSSEIFDTEMKYLADSGTIQPTNGSSGLPWQGQRWRISAGAFQRWLIEQRKWDDLQPARPKTLSAAERDHLRNVLEQKQRRLYVLEEQLARQGRANAQPQIIIDIKELKREIAEIERRLGESGG